jgi:hypothetical protein
LQALVKGASSVEIGIIIGIAPFAWMVASPTVGYLVSTITTFYANNQIFNNFTSASQAWS